MKIALLSLVLFFSNQVLVLAQEQQDSNISIFSVQDVNVQLGFITGGNTRLSLEEFKLFAPKSELLNNELWEKSDRRGLMVSVKGLFSMQMGIHFGDKQKMKYKSNPFLRLGFTYYSGMSFAGDFELKERHSSDTLQSGQTGQQILIDSITNSTLRCRYRLQQLRLDASLIFRTNPAARWSLYTGLGMTGGLSIKASTDIDYTRSSSTEIIYSDGTSNSHHTYDERYESEVFINENISAFSVYLPMGIDFRMGRKKEFWKRLHLFYEIRPGIDFIKIPELGNFSNGSFQNGFGLKVSWN